MTVTKTPIVISTISDLAESGMTLGLYCLECDRWGEIIPQEWLDAGKPDVDYVEQKFKCSKCGGRADKQVRSSPTGFCIVPGQRAGGAAAVESA